MRSQRSKNVQYAPLPSGCRAQTLSYVNRLGCSPQLPGAGLENGPTTWPREGDRLHEPQIVLLASRSETRPFEPRLPAVVTSRHVNQHVLLLLSKLSLM
jgi:hypothetical protein